MIEGLLTTLGWILVSAAFHESAHGWVAEKCGDPTARLAGRITLNPLKHIDPMWSFVIPLMLYLGSHGGFVLGGAKPTPVNLRNVRSPRTANILISAAGPVSNLLLAVAATLLLIPLGKFAAPGTVNAYVLGYGVLVNLTLAAFNLLPIPPLDGSHVLESIAPPSLAGLLRRARPFGFIILVVFMMSKFDRVYMQWTVVNGIDLLDRMCPRLLPVLQWIVNRQG